MCNRSLEVVIIGVIRCLVNAVVSIGVIVRLRAGEAAQRAWGDTIEAPVRRVAALKSGLGDASKNYRCEGFHLA